MKRRTTEEDRDERRLHALQRKAFAFFARATHPRTGLVRDSTQPGTPCSIAGVGFALSCYVVAIERGFMTRKEGLARALAAVRFFDAADQRGGADGTGYRGFFYHFLDMATGRRAWDSELSTIDTALLLAGMLLAAQYFDGTSAHERELRERVAAVYARVDWRWAQQGEPAIALSWTPEDGFSRGRWRGYSEAMLLYVLALAAPEHAVRPEAYAAWTAPFRWRRVYGHELLYAGPLFIHQFSHVWIDLRGIQDAFMVGKESDYFENSRRATYVQREYAIRNPRGFECYDAECWGFTASNGPGPATRRRGGREQRFYGYAARGAPFGPDDGTVSPFAAIASLPFAPEIVLPTIRGLHARVGTGGFGFDASINPSFRTHGRGWVWPWHYALNQGPIVLMIENYRSGLVWRLMRDCAVIERGLRRAGFARGWLA